MTNRSSFVIPVLPRADVAVIVVIPIRSRLSFLDSNADLRHAGAQLIGASTYMFAASGPIVLSAGTDFWIAHKRRARLISQRLRRNPVDVTAARYLRRPAGMMKSD
ncbi:hypothetical protein [Bradyrhizobium sp. USDA 4354]